MVSDYISREAALDAVFGQFCASSDGTEAALNSAVEDIKRIPAADVRPVVPGKWKNNHCSACGMMPMGEEIWECCDFAPPKFEWFMNYCPNCGAWMEES